MSTALPNGSKRGIKDDGSDQSAMQKRARYESDDLPLPTGWETFVHECGLTFFRHVPTNVCSVTRPFQLSDDELLLAHPIPTFVVPRPAALPAVGETGISELCAYYNVLRDAVRASRSESNRKKDQAMPKETIPREEPDWAVVAAGKPATALLNELCMQRFKTPPNFVFVNIADPEKPFGVAVEVDGTRFEVGCGSSKRVAKQQAAIRALETLLPQVYRREDATEDTRCESHESAGFKKYDDIPIIEESISSSVASGGAASPAQLLQCYCNLYMPGQEPQLVMEDTPEGQSFVMRLGSTEIKGTARGKRHARQRASQLMLAALHPDIKNWGGLLRLYSHSELNKTEDKEEHKPLAALEGAHDVNEPNEALLERLRAELLKLYSNRLTPNQTGLPAVYGPPPIPQKQFQRT